LNRAGTDISVLGDIDQVKVLNNVLKTNKAVCDAIGQSYLPQLSVIYNDMLVLYKTISNFITEAVVAQGKPYCDGLSVHLTHTA
jgi:exportin-1